MQDNHNNLNNQSNTNIVVGIEGLVGAGKTSICREIIKKDLNFVLVNGGNIYRAIVYALLKNGSKLEGLQKQGNKLDIKSMMDLLGVKIKIENMETIIYINGTRVSEEELQSKENSMAVSKIGGKANNEGLFKFAENLINELKEKYNVLVSGRSVMKIYPACDYHFFVVADLDERVRRKCMQYENKNSQEEIKQNIIERDRLQKEAGFYDYSSITEEIDVTNCKTVEESTELVLSKIKLPELV